MIEDDLIYMLKVGMYENSQKQGSYRREKSGEKSTYERVTHT